MKYLLVIAFWLTLSLPAFAQDYKKHTVEKGETVLSISKKYKITPYDIYRLNPDAKNGLKTNTVLLIPNNPVKPLPAGAEVKAQPTKVTNTVHTVAAGETLFSIAKKYSVSVADLEKANAGHTAGGLKTGQELIIPVKGSGVAAQAKVAEKQLAKKQETTYMYHTVEAGETKFGIAKKFGMTVQLIEELNPEVKDTLPLGFRLKLAKNEVIAESKVAEPAEVAKPAPASAGYKTYTVQPKETLYSLTKSTGLTEDQLTALNPELKDGLKEGMELKLPAGTNVAVAVTGKAGNLSATLDKDSPKKLALLLPFNMSSIEKDTVRSKKLRTDKLLNLTLDFYAGALVAIDSARAMGLPVNVSILDAKETTKTSDVAGLKSSLAGTDAIIGPFFQNNAESAAALFPNAVVISPLAKEAGHTYPNLYYSIPSDEAMRTALFDYIKSKNGNVVAITDSKKASARSFIKTNYPEFRMLEGAITGDGIRALLVKGKTNYVILDTETLSNITGTLKLLDEATAEYTIQMAIPDKTDKYDHDEVSLPRLMKLKLLYPSITRDDQGAQTALFAKVFREKNGSNPTPYATRGFDITFDTLLRLFQPEGIKASMGAKTSVQVENKFIYLPQNGGNFNNGVFIMQYNDGLTVTEAQ
jgi:LysM repeat protein